MNARVSRSLLGWQRIDRQLCASVNDWGGRRSVLHLFSVVSRLGDGVFWYALMAALLVVGGTTGAQAAVHMAGVGLLAALLYRHLKRWTRRPRPFRCHTNIVARLPPLDEFSFPSGHTLHAVSFSLVAIDYFPMLAIALAPFALMVAASRVVLGLHYPSDVIAASVIGIVLARSSFWLLESLAQLTPY